jgi:hypothetical protein
MRTKEVLVIENYKEIAEIIDKLREISSNLIGDD